jgi:hypothetical protein
MGVAWVGGLPSSRNQLPVDLQGWWVQDLAGGLDEPCQRLQQRSHLQSHRRPLKHPERDAIR